MTDQQPKEFRLKGGSTILDYLNRFSATEKAVFGLLFAAAVITAIYMAATVNSYFTVEVPADGGALREGLIGLPHAINPVLAVTDPDRDISSLVYAGLTRNENGKVLPDLASDWSVSADGLTYTFNLRPGLTFQDGSPFSADDVVFTIEKIQDPALKSPRAADWEGVVATSTSPLTVEFSLKSPYNSFLSNTDLGILPKHIWGGVSDDQFIFSAYNIEPVGAGPYKESGVDRDQGGIPTAYHLSAWSGYHDGKPHIGEIVFSFFPDEEHALAALSGGYIDSLPAVSPEAAAKLASNVGEPYRITTAPLSRIFGVFFDQNNNSVLADPVVRKALADAVDRKALIATVFGGFGTAAYGPLPPGIESSEQTATASSAVPDTSAIRAYLEKAGWSMGADGVFGKKVSRKSATTTLAFTLYTADASELKSTASFLKDAWAKIGASVDVKIFEPNDLYQSVIRTRSYDALLFGEAVGRDGDLYAFWHSSERNSPGLNVAMYANSKVDKALEAIRAATSSEDKSDLYAKLEGYIGSDNPAIFLYSPDFVYAVPKTLRGLGLGVMVQPSDRFDSVRDWYVETENVWGVFAR